MAKGYTYMR